MPPPNDSGLGPLSFELNFLDSFDTRVPQAPITGIETSVDVNIVVHWNLARTELEDSGVEYDPIVWTKAGPGPHDVFEDQLGLSERKKVGTITWSLVTKTQKWIQKDGARFRMVVTVIPTLMLTQKRTGVSAPAIEIRQTQPIPCHGAWQNLPPSLSTG